MDWVGLDFRQSYEIDVDEWNESAAFHLCSWLPLPQSRRGRSCGISLCRVAPSDSREQVCFALSLSLSLSLCPSLFVSLSFSLSLSLSLFLVLCCCGFVPSDWRNVLFVVRNGHGGVCGARCRENRDTACPYLCRCDNFLLVCVVSFFLAFFLCFGCVALLGLLR